MRSWRLLAALAMGAFAAVVVSAPASGASLPLGEHITVLDPATGSVYTADPATGSLTLVAAGSPWVAEQPTGIDVDDSGHGYLVSTDISQVPLLGASKLWAFDATTGQASNPVALTIDDGVAPSNAWDCQGIDLRSDGVPVVTCTYFDTGTGYEISSPVDPSTGVMTTNAASGAVLLVDAGLQNLTAAAANPVSGQPFFFQWDAADPAGRDLVYDSAYPSPGIYAEVPISRPVWSADFDRDGQLFVATEGTGGEPVLATIDTASAGFTDVGDMTIAGAPLPAGDMLPLTVWGSAPMPKPSSGPSSAPSLAATGSELRMPLAVGSAAILLGATVHSRRRRTRPIAREQ